MSLEDIKLTLVKSTSDVDDMLSWLGQRREFLAFDVETTGLNRGKDRNRLFQLGDMTQGFALDYEDWRGVCRQVIETYEGPMAAHNLLFDSSMLAKDGFKIRDHLMHDTMVMIFLQDSSQWLGLKPSAKRLIDPRAGAGEGLKDQAMSNGGWDWATIPIEVPSYWAYGVLDTCLTAGIAEKLHSATVRDYREAYELELAVISCLRSAELAGLMTDPDYITRAASKLEDELAVLRPLIPCNPNSDKKVVEVLQGLGATLTVRTEKGNLSVDKHVLRHVERFQGVPLAGTIATWKSKERMLNSYLRKFEDLAVGGVLRASTRPLGARTGRQSVTDPPLQTLPRGRVVRDAVIARDGYRLVMADFSGMEMRALASFAQEANMLAAYSRGEDLHNFVASSVYGENFTKIQRGVAKNAGFAKIYGAGLAKFAATAQIPEVEAEQFLARYAVLFPGVDSFMQRVTEQVMERAGGKRSQKGWVTLIDGRRLMVDGSKPYTGVNYLIQGSCAVATKRKIVELCDAGLGDCFRLAVHDELIFEVPQHATREARFIISQVMPDRRSFPGTVLEIEDDEVERWGQHYRGDDYPKYVDTPDPEWLAAA